MLWGGVEKSYTATVYANRCYNTGWRDSEARDLRVSKAVVGTRGDFQRPVYYTTNPQHRITALFRSPFPAITRPMSNRIESGYGVYSFPTKAVSPKAFMLQ